MKLFEIVMGRASDGAVAGYAVATCADKAVDLFVRSRNAAKETTASWSRNDLVAVRLLLDGQEVLLPGHRSSKGPVLMMKEGGAPGERRAAPGTAV